MAKRKNLLVYKDEFIKLYDEGKSIREIARLYDVNKGSVSRILKENIEIRQKNALTGKESEIYEMFYGGAKRAEIAEVLGVAYSTVTNFLVKAGEITVNSLKYEDLIPHFVEDYKKGLSINEIADKYGVTHSSVHTYILQEFGETRTYSETARKYEINENYFDVLDDKKAYQIGLIFELAGIYKGIGSDKIVLTSKYNSNFLLDAVDGIVNKDEIPVLVDSEDGTSSVSINSTYLKDMLLGFGIKSETLRLPLEFIDNFMRGYFATALSIQNRSIYISLGKPFSQSILDYLKDSLCISYNTRTKSLVILNKDGIFKLVKKFPEIIDKIDLYLEKNPTNTYWRRRKDDFLK